MPATLRFERSKASRDLCSARRANSIYRSIRFCLFSVFDIVFCFLELVPLRRRAAAGTDEVFASIFVIWRTDARNAGKIYVFSLVIAGVISSARRKSSGFMFIRGKNISHVCVKRNKAAMTKMQSPLPEYILTGAIRIRSIVNWPFSGSGSCLCRRPAPHRVGSPRRF